MVFHGRSSNIKTAPFNLNSGWRIAMLDTRLSKLATPTRLRLNQKMIRASKQDQEFGRK